MKPLKFRIRIDSEDGPVLCDPKDWQRSEGVLMLLHTPSGSAFRIEVDEQALEFELDLRYILVARLARITEGYEIPTIARQVELGRAAITMVLHMIGVWTPRKWGKFQAGVDAETKTRWRKLDV